MHLAAPDFDASPDPDDRTLASAAAAGQASAFGMLCERHMDAIYRYIYLRTGDSARAEDLTEDVFVKAWEAMPGYRPSKHPFTSWLYRIAHNLVVDHYRTQSRRKPEHDVDPADRPDPGQLPEDLVVEQQDIAELSAAIQQLTEDEQQVIVLRFVEGLGHREVAAIIGKSESASRVTQHRALAALAAVLGEGGTSDDG